MLSGEVINVYNRSTFKAAWPVAIELSGSDPLISIDVSIDGVKPSAGEIPISTTKLHAKRGIHLHKISYDGSSPNVTVMRDGALQPWKCIRRNSYGNLSDCDIYIGSVDGEPIYPPIARAAHVGGTVVLHATISSSGAVESLTAISGPAMLQGAALDAVRQWKYKPYLLDGAAVPVDTTITVNFNLNNFNQP